MAEHYRLTAFRDFLNDCSLLQGLYIYLGKQSRRGCLGEEKIRTDFKQY